MSKKLKSKIVFFAVIISILSLIFIPMTNAVAQNQKIPTYPQSSSDHNLLMFENSHYYQPIYVNYSVLDLSFLLLGPQANVSTRVYVHYSQNQADWTTIEFVDLVSISETSALFQGLVGPFNKTGEYYLIMNATRGTVTELARSYYRINVVSVQGLLFIDLTYNVRVLNTTDQFADLYINILGDVKNSTVEASFDQQDNDEEPYLLTPYQGSKWKYNLTIGPINTWDNFVQITFTANTTSGTMYTNTDFFFYKDYARIKEDFWRSTFPAIIIGGGILIAISVIFIFSRRGPPRSFDETKLESKKKRKRKKKEKEEL
ncbi:MAG: hypothetical protein E3J70_05870 [Candidatus Heimdallarchaeota archaeon]|nr:MAG: hypothetical protein E3J70_05870 [Candidatus Heimdallarchaeota archaeon]